MPRRQNAEPLYHLKPAMREILEALCTYGGLTRGQLSTLLGYTLVYNESGNVEADGYLRGLVKDLIVGAQYVEALSRDFTSREGRKADILRLTTQRRHALATLRRCGIRQLECASIPNKDDPDHFVEVNDFRVRL